MEFSIIAEIFERMENTTKRIELTNLLVELLKKIPKKIIRMLFIFYKVLSGQILKVLN